MGRKRLLSIIVMASLAPAATLGAQDAKQEFASAQKSNAAAARQYTWKSRTELKLKGESKNIKLEQVRYDIDGKLQKTVIGGSPQQQPGSQPSGGRLRGRVKERVVENKKEEFAELMQSLAGLVLSYVHMTPDQIQAFSQNATIAPEQDGSLLIKGSNVLQQGDSLSVRVDSQTMMMRRVEIMTSLEKKPVHFVAEFQSLSNGPTHMARGTLQYPEKGVEVVIDNHEYQRVGS